MCILYNLQAKEFSDKVKEEKSDVRKKEPNWLKRQEEAEIERLFTLLRLK